jgi:hypothetical protein
VPPKTEKTSSLWGSTFASRDCPSGIQQYIKPLLSLSLSFFSFKNTRLHEVLLIVRCPRRQRRLTTTTLKKTAVREKKEHSLRTKRKKLITKAEKGIKMKIFS